MNEFWQVNAKKSVAVVCILLFNFVFFHFFKYNNHLPDPSFKRTKNAIWLGHKWVGERLEDTEYSLLCAKLKNGRMTDVFAHVGTLDEQGNIEYKKYHYAKEFLVQVKACDPEIHIQAWIGQVELKGGGVLDINQTAIRTSIIETADILLQLGFDGIHYNIEPIFSGDEAILDLLQKTHLITKANGKFLSIASDEIEPFPFADKLIRIFARRAGFWTKDYYLQIANHVDQIAVMMYDTAIPFAWFYGYVVKWQVEKITTLLDGKVLLFFGVPTYEEERWSFHANAENMFSGIRGISMGIEEIPLPILENKFGIAIYSEWTTDDAEWKTFKTDWLLSY